MGQAATGDKVEGSKKGDSSSVWYSCGSRAALFPGVMFAVVVIGWLLVCTTASWECMRSVADLRGRGLGARTARAPACPVAQLRRWKRMMPRMLRQHGM